MKVVQMGLGPVGIAVARLAAQRPGLQLAGAIDPRPDLAGRDLGEILGRAPMGVGIFADPATLLREVRPQVVLHATSSFLTDVAHQLRGLVEAGVSVVSTCEELSYPFYRHPELAAELNARAAQRGVVLLGTGINPGFVMDKLVVTLFGACRSASAVRVRRIVDASKRREPLQRKIGAGLAPAAFEERRRTGRFGHIGLAESAHMIADALGVGRDRSLRESLEPVIASAPVITPFLRVEPGQASGIKQFALIEAGGREPVRLDLRMAVDAADPVDAIEINGSPSVSMTIAGGIHGDEGTAAVVVNAAYSVCDLKPGLRTMLDLPLRGFDLGAPTPPSR